MFDQVLQLVKQQIGNNPQVASAIPPGKEEEVHKEVANGVTDGLKSNLTGGAGGIGGMISSLTGGGGGNSGDIVSSVQKAVADRLKGKFGLPDSAINAITSALPGIVQKFRGS